MPNRSGSSLENCRERSPAGSNPVSSAKFQFVFQSVFNLDINWQTIQIRNPPSKIVWGRLTGRTRDSGSRNKGSNPFPKANFNWDFRFWIIIKFLGCSADGYTGLPWKQVFAGSNPAALTNFESGVLCPKSEKHF